MVIDRPALRHAGAVVALAMALLASQPAAAQSYGGPASNLHAGTLEVPLNKSQVVSTDRPIAKAMVGSNEIADILPITDRSIYVLGKKMGTTSLSLYDPAGRVLAIMDVAVGPDVEQLSARLKDLMPGEDIEARISNESVILSGTVNNAGAIDKALQIAKTFAGDKVVNLVSLGSSQQVMLEVRFAEVKRSTGKDIGVSAGLRSNNGSFRGVVGAGAGWTGATPGTTNVTVDSDGKVTSQTTGIIDPIFGLSAITNTFGVFGKSFNLGNVNVNALLNALETRGLAKTLAQPTLIALSGEKAAFLAGGEFPVPVAQASSGGVGAVTAITIEFKSFGVSLGFTPTVLGDKTINMIVEPEVSEIDPSASITLNGIVIPGLRTRRASTTLELRDGESFAIAGLLQRDFKTNISQMPLLGSIPILGALFRSTQFQKGETELLIVVTPHLVAPIQPGQVRLPTDRIKDPSQADTFLLGQPYDPRPLAPLAPLTPRPLGSPQSDAGVGTVGSPAQPAESQPPAAQAPPRKDDKYAY